MSGSPVKISGTFIQSGATNDDHPDAEIISLATEIAQRCSELDGLDERNGSPGTERYCADGDDMMDVQTTEIAVEIDCLEEKIAKCRAITIEGLKAKATIAETLRRFGYESIPDSIIRDLITIDGPLARVGKLSAA